VTWIPDASETTHNVLQASAVTALETASDDSLTIAGAFFALSMSYARVIVALSREG
jgi:hypothetical protein